MGKKEKKITRRDFMKKVGTGATAVGVASMMPRLVKSARGAKRDYILIGRPDPATGPLAAFSEPTPWTDNRALKAINKDGGIYIKEAGRKLPIKIKLMDTESNPTKAAELAAKLILRDKVDIMMPMHTPLVVNPVSAICERYETPSIGIDDPIEAWLTGGPYKWSFCVYLTVETLIDAFITVWDEYADKTNKVVGGLWPNDPDGVMFANIFHKKLPAKGYKVVDPGRFPMGMKDWGSVINRFKNEKVEILTSVLISPGWASLWRQCHQLGFIPKIATSARAFIFPSEPTALGENLAEGVTIGCAWSPFHQYKSSLTGESAKELCDAWTKEHNKPWSQDMGFKYAGFEIAADVLRRTQSLDKNKIREAIAKTDIDTIIGPIKINEQNYSDVNCTMAQWVKGKKFPWELAIVNNMGIHEVPKTANLIFPIPNK